VCPCPQKRRREGGSCADARAGRRSTMTRTR
jgi:hypothetical protein